MSSPSPVPTPRPRRGLIFVRHGRTAANAQGLLLGRADPPLDDTGRAQADAVVRAIDSGRFGEIAAVVASPLLRTRQSADALGRPVELDSRFIELDYGEWEGVPLTELDPQLWRAWRSDLHFAPPQGESLATLTDRVGAACDDWSSRELGPGSVIVVSHVSPIKAAVAWALGVGGEIAWRTHLDTSSITWITCRGESPTLSSFNDTSHLRS